MYPKNISHRKITACCALSQKLNTILDGKKSEGNKNITEKKQSIPQNNSLRKRILSSNINLKFIMI